MRAQPLTQAEPDPLERLSAFLAEDMKKVNGLIVRRLQSDVQLIPQVASYLVMAGGKRIRPLLTLACTRLFDAETQRPHGLAASVEFIHTATLLHDDVVDESRQRRGQESANEVFGNKSSVLVGDFLFSRAFQLMVEDGSLDVLRILSTASAIIAEGEVMQLQASSDIGTDLASYERIIGAKTAALFAAACEIGPVVTGQDEALRHALRDYGHHLGMAFQIADDVLDYSPERSALGKTVGDDFREGRMTAPVIFALQDADPEEKSFWRRTMENGGGSAADLDRAIAILRGRGAFDKGLDLAYSHAERARGIAQALPPHPLSTMLGELALHAAGRDR